jgi:hypothetical protein
LNTVDSRYNAVEGSEENLRYIKSRLYYVSYIKLNRAKHTFLTCKIPQLQKFYNSKLTLNFATKGRPTRPPISYLIYVFGLFQFDFVCAIINL